MHFKVQAACATLLPRFWPGIPRACGGPGLALIIESVFKSMTAGVRRSVFAAAVAAALVGGCASGDTGAAEVWDPIETPKPVRLRDQSHGRYDRSPAARR